MTSAGQIVMSTRIHIVEMLCYHDIENSAYLASIYSILPPLLQHEPLRTAATVSLLAANSMHGACFLNSFITRANTVWRHRFRIPRVRACLDGRSLQSLHLSCILIAAVEFSHAPAPAERL